MNYVGRVLSSVKGFYNDINPSTLTGAIDVLIVKQADGTFLTSPWHVRFGKMGVMRAKQKVVDIEVNGEPVDLHMKLGDAGEAFFVQEAEPTQLAEMPGYLATSPLFSALEFMERGLEQSKADTNCLHDSSINDSISANFDSSATLAEESMAVVSLIENEAFMSVDSISLSNVCLSEAAISKSDQILEDGFLNDSQRTRSKRSVSAQTDLSGRIDTIKDSSPLVASKESSNLSGKGFSDVNSKDASFHAHADRRVSFDQRDNISFNQRDDISDVSVSEISQLLERVASHEAAGAGQRRHRRRKSKSMQQDEFFTPKTSFAGLEAFADVDGELEMFEMDLGGAKENGSEDGYQTCEVVQSPAVQARRLSALNTLDSSELKLKPWPLRQLLPDSFHSFSDVEFTPVESPADSRPSSPKSDTEVLQGIHDATSQTQLTGDRFYQLDDILWKWGRLPEPPSPCGQGLDPFRPPPDPCCPLESEPCERVEDSSVSITSKQGIKTVIETKEEIFLEDIKRDGMSTQLEDQYSHTSPQMKTETVRDDDTEGGTSQSLPQSPDTGEPDSSILMGSKVPAKRSWYWRWGSRKQGTSTSSTPAETKDVATSPPSRHASSSPESSQHIGHGASTKHMGTLSSDEENEVPSVSIHRPSVVKDPSFHSSSMVRAEFMKSLKLSSEQIAKLNLSEGMNEASFSVTTQYQGTARCTCFIFLWNWNDKVVVSDIDGTITRSDVLGQVLPMLPLISHDWSQVGIANLYSMIHNNGYRFLYLSARAIGQSRLTRDYLCSLRQGEVRMPNGPLLLSPSSLASAFHREVIERKPEIFKISCLGDIRNLFPASHNPFFAGFGNKINDVWAYRTVGVSQDRIFTVNHKGELRIETLQSYQSSYTFLSDIVDHFFPPLPDLPSQSGGKSPCIEYNSFSFWREALPDVGDEIAEFVKKSAAEKKKEKKTSVRRVNSKAAATTKKLSVKR